MLYSGKCVFSFIIIVIKETVSCTIRSLISHDRIDMYILYALKDIALNIWTLCPKFLNKTFDLTAFGTLLCSAAAGAALCKSACTLDEMKSIVVTPLYNILFSYKIKRSYSAPYLQSW